MKTQKKKIKNFRPILCAAVLMIAAIFLVCRVCVSQKSRMIFGALLLVSIIASFALMFYKKKIFKLVLPALIIIFIPVFSVYVKAEKINSNQTLNVENCNIYGKIYKINNKLDKNYIDVYLTDVELFSENETLEFYGNYLLRINSNNFNLSKLELGKYIKSKIIPNFYNPNSGDTRDLSFISRDIMGFSYVYSYNVYVTDELNKSLRDRIKEKVHEYFQETDLFFSGVGYALMFGDSTELDDSVYCVFESSGTIHLLAVSGFHVSLIVGCILFILKKLKVKNVASFIITAVVISFYAYLCNFSVSIVRAGIMSLLMIYAAMRNKEYDRMSAVSLAIVMILILNPMDLFNISFVLSFVAVLSIILLLPVFERIFAKVFSDKLAGSLALTLSTSIGLTIFQLYYFGKAPILAFLSNIITVPIVSMLFILLLASVLIGPLLGVVVPMINVFGFGIKYVLQLNNWIANIGLFLVSNNVREITLLLSLILMFSLSDYLFIKKKSRIALTMSIGGLLLSLLIF